MTDPELSMPTRTKPLSHASLAPAPPLGLRLMGVALEQLLQAERFLARDGEARHAGIHEARKCIRRTRAILALGKETFGGRSRAIDLELGQLCRGLSPLRDAQALIEALQRLAHAAPADVAAILPDAEMAARQQRDLRLTQALARDPLFATRRLRLRALGKRLARMDWLAVQEADVTKAMRRSEKRAEKAGKRAGRNPDRDRAWHVFRRRVRRVRQQHTVLSELLHGFYPDTKSLEERACALGEAQDDALLLRHCGRSLPFTPHQRTLLRRIARVRLRSTRITGIRGSI